MKTVSRIIMSSRRPSYRGSRRSWVFLWYVSVICYELHCFFQSWEILLSSRCEQHCVLMCPPPDKIYNAASRLSCVHAEVCVPGHPCAGGDVMPVNAYMNWCLDVSLMHQTVSLALLSITVLLEKWTHLKIFLLMPTCIYPQSLMLAERACVYNMLINLMDTREAGKR